MPRPADVHDRLRKPPAVDEERAVERRFEDEEQRGTGRSTRRQIIRGVLLLTLAAITLYVLGPGLVEVLSSAPRLGEIGWWWFPVMLALEVGAFWCLWAVEWISIRGAGWWEISTTQLVGNALGRILPGGGAVAGAVQYRMLVDTGVPRGTVATGLTATNFLTFGVLLGLPVLAIPAILDGAVAQSIRSLLAWGLMLLVAIVVGAVVLIVTDRPLRWTGAHVQALRNRLRRQGSPLSGLPERLVSERDLIVSVVGERWKRALLASIGRWMLDLAVLIVALEAIGARPAMSLVLLSYFASQLLAQIPITPGGLGFVEAGLTATLALAGVNGGDAVLATLAYRLISYWLPIPAGGVAWLMFRRRYPGSEERVTLSMTSSG